jgi:hypothetical protein
MGSIRVKDENGRVRYHGVYNCFCADSL